MAIILFAVQILLQNQDMTTAKYLARRRAEREQERADVLALRSAGVHSQSANGANVQAKASHLSALSLAENHLASDSDLPHTHSVTRQRHHQDQGAHSHQLQAHAHQQLMGLGGIKENSIIKEEHTARPTRQELPRPAPEPYAPFEERIGLLENLVCRDKKLHQHATERPGRPNRMAAQKVELRRRRASDHRNGRRDAG